MIIPQWRETTREAWRNILTGTSHAIRWSLVLVGLTGSLAWFDTSSVRNLVDTATEYVSRGGAIWTLRAPNAISGVACDALIQVDSVVNAGALLSDQSRIATATLPRAPIPVYAVTPRFPLIAAALNIGDSGTTGLVASDQVAERYGLETATAISGFDGSIPIVAIYEYPDDGRRSDFGFALLQPTHVSQVFDECWITVWPTDDRVASLLYTTLLPPADPSTPHNARIGHLNPQLATAFDASGAYEERVSRWAPLAGFMAGVVVGVAAVWTRRLEHSSSLHAGLPHSFLTVQVLQECLFWTGSAATLCVLVVALPASGSLADTTAVLACGIRVIIASACGSLLGTAIAITTIREEYLFTYFKAR